MPSGEVSMLYIYSILLSSLILKFPLCIILLDLSISYITTIPIPFNPTAKPLPVGAKH